VRALVVVLSLFATLAHAEDAAPACDRATCFALQLHIAPTADGLVVTPEWIAAQVATANRQFAALDVGFQIAGSDVLPASAAHLRTRADRSALAPYVEGKVIHVFVTGQLDNVDDDKPVYGVTWRTGARKFVILAANARDLVLAHELGHVFGLPHSTYAISIMNKTKRAAPPIEERRFADEELAAMRPAVRRLVRAKILENVRSR
jgi:hypothetical protein